MKDKITFKKNLEYYKNLSDDELLEKEFIESFEESSGDDFLSFRKQGRLLVSIFRLKKSIDKLERSTLRYSWTLISLTFFLVILTIILAIPVIF